MAQITRRSFTAAGIAGAITMLATGGFALSAGAQEALRPTSWHLHGYRQWQGR